MKTLNQLRVEARVSIQQVSEFIGLSYIETSKIFKEKVVCDKSTENQIKIFLLNNYTKCIDDVFKRIKNRKEEKQK